MNAKPNAPSHIEKALELDGKVESIKDYYADWSASYDKDLRGDHVAPYHLAVQLQQWLNSNRPDFDHQNASVMDVGCGTGLVGTALSNIGFTKMDGVDLSPHMIEQARRLDLYQELSADVDINQRALECAVTSLGLVAQPCCC